MNYRLSSASSLRTHGRQNDLAKASVARIGKWFSTGPSLAQQCKQNHQLSNGLRYRCTRNSRGLLRVPDSCTRRQRPLDAPRMRNERCNQVCMHGTAAHCNLLHRPAQFRNDANKTSGIKCAKGSNETPTPVWSKLDPMQNALVANAQKTPFLNPDRGKRWGNQSDATEQCKRNL